ncbi:MAG: DUF547 domain-containing protein [Paracoccaceae bacterium]
MHRRTFLIATAAAVSMGSAQAAPSAELWRRWMGHVAGSTDHVDHSAWDALLQKHVLVGKDGIARVGYRGFGGSRSKLDGYLAALRTTNVSGLDRPEQMAYWINLYNAVTLQVVLDHYPVESIRDIDISPGIFANGPWGAKLAEVEGVPVSLDDIEHRILRPIWKDPRIHYAVNCASIGCPNLAVQAFTGARLETMLDTGARAYVGHSRGCSIEAGRVTASKIYDWFQEDFGGTEAGVIAHLRQHGAKGLESATGIDSYQYDWSLNAA